MYAHQLLDSKDRHASESQFDFAVRSLEQLVFSGDIKAGEKLPSEREFVNRYGVSRTVWREALRAIEARGLIKVVQGKGVYVQKPGLWTVIDPMRQLLRDQSITLKHLMQARSILEPEIVRLASLNAQEDQLEILEQDYARMTKTLDNIEKNVAVIKDFHNHLAYATGNPVLAIMIWPIIALIPNFIDLFSTMPESSRKVCENHDKILAALKNRDPDSAEAALRTHLIEVMKLFENRSDEDFSVIKEE